MRNQSNHCGRGPFDHRCLEYAGRFRKLVNRLGVLRDGGGQEQKSLLESMFCWKYRLLLLGTDGEVGVAVVDLFLWSLPSSG